MGTLKVDSSTEFIKTVEVFKEVFSKTPYSLAKYATPDYNAIFSFTDEPDELIRELRPMNGGSCGVAIVSPTETARFPQFHDGFWSISTSYVLRPAGIADISLRDYDHWIVRVFQERFFEEMVKLAKDFADNFPPKASVEVKLFKQSLRPAPSFEEAEKNWKFISDHW